MADFKVNLVTPTKPREANQFVSENIRQQPSGPIQLRPEYAFSVERRCIQAISKQNGLVTDLEFSYTERSKV